MTRRQLSIDADLDLTVDGHPVAVRGDGQRVTVTVDTAETAWRMFKGRRPGRRLVRTVTDTLEQFGIDVEVVVDGQSLLTVGPSAVASRVTSALGLQGVQVDPAVARHAWTVPDVRRGVLAAAFAAGLLLGVRR